MIVGLTSGIGGGKSTAVKLFSNYGINYVDADEISHHLTAPGTLLSEEIIGYFGENYRNQDGSLNRQALRKKIFTSRADRAWLENLLHPFIRAELVQQLQQYRGPYALLVAPLLFETSLDKVCNKTIVISLTEERQLERVCARDKISEKQARKILAAQMPMSDKIKRADYVIENNGSKEELAKKIAQLHHQLLKLSNLKSNES